MTTINVPRNAASVTAAVRTVGSWSITGRLIMVPSSGVYCTGASSDVDEPVCTG
jgi:hypothetical protein